MDANKQTETQMEMYRDRHTETDVDEQRHTDKKMQRRTEKQTHRYTERRGTVRTDTGTPLQIQ